MWGISPDEFCVIDALHQNNFPRLFLIIMQDLKVQTAVQDKESKELAQYGRKSLSTGYKSSNDLEKEFASSHQRLKRWSHFPPSLPARETKKIWLFSHQICQRNKWAKEQNSLLFPQKRKSIDQNPEKLRNRSYAKTLGWHLSEWGRKQQLQLGISSASNQTAKSGLLVTVS